MRLFASCQLNSFESWRANERDLSLVCKWHTKEAAGANRSRTPLLNVIRQQQEGKESKEEEGESPQKLSEDGD